MAAAVHQRPAKTMPVAVRPMTADDLQQAVEVEKDAFPTMFPPTSFRRELKNSKAHYLVAYRTDKPAPTLSNERPRGLVSNLVRGLWRQTPVSRADQDYVVGFLGLWYMVGEAHIVSVGVRTDQLRQGIGELLVIAAIDHAIARQAEVATLEVRPSNTAARSLYKKYTLTDRGLRKAYYSDNHEDAIIMTSEPIQMAQFQQQFQALKRAHERRWGRADITVGL